MNEKWQRKNLSRCPKLLDHYTMATSWIDADMFALPIPENNRLINQRVTY